jgi:predicted PurR-regulated permease PerM
MFAKALFIIGAILLMTFYWTLESDRVFRTLSLLFPSSKRAGIREVIDAVEGKLGSYLFGQGILMLVIGILSLIAYLIIGLPNALVLALIAGVMEAVPVIGPILGAVPAVLVAASTNPANIIWVIVASIIIQLAENNLLVPRIMNRSVGVNPLLTILSIAALSSLIGLPGAVLAVPIAAIIQFLINRFVIAPVREPDMKPEGRDTLSVLRLQIQELANDSRKQAPEEKEGMRDIQDEERFAEMIEALAKDLDQVLAQVPQAEEAHGVSR